MKHFIIVSVFVSVFLLAFPILTALGSAAGNENIAYGRSDFLPGTDAPEGDTPDAESASGFDSSFTVRLLDNGTVKMLPMSEYLRGALAAEMPASFEDDALAAQAVAIRTYVLHSAMCSASPHGDADVCSESTCCLAWHSDDFFKERWGESYDTYSAKIENAITETDGVYASYAGEPVLAAFHSSSCGATESSRNVWAESLPYLISVKSPETADDVPNYTVSVDVSPEEFKTSILSIHPDAVFEGEPQSWFGAALYTASGRLSSVPIGGVTVTGSELRSVFSLRSTSITLSSSADCIRLTSSGYGHGVGMSQYGANAMARSGSSWEDILLWYYPGISLKTMVMT